MKSKTSVRLDPDALAIVKGFCKRDASKPSIAQKTNELIRGLIPKLELQRNSTKQIVVGSRKTFRRVMIGRDVDGFINVNSFESSCGYRYREDGGIMKEFVALFDADGEAVQNLIVHGFKLVKP